MDIFLDLEKTLLKDDHTISKEDLKRLSLLALEHKIYILTTALLYPTRKIIQDENISIISTLENKIDPPYITSLLPKDLIEKLRIQDTIISMYSVVEDACYIYKYQERLKLFYPAQKLKLTSYVPSASIIIACLKKDYEGLQKYATNYAIEVLAEDSKKLLFKLSATPSSKESYIKYFKKDQAIGIGDSFEDYGFIKHCEIQVAMKNAEANLKELCQYQTQKTNQQGGAVQFLIDHLKKRRQMS